MVLLLFLLVINRYESIGVMGAMDDEVSLIKEIMSVEHTDTLAHRIFFIGKLYDIPCVCVKAGVGKVNSAITAQILITKYNVDAIIFTGVAGGINPEINIGDIVISKRVIHHDYGSITPEGFFPFDTLGFVADSFLIEVAKKAAKNIKFETIPQKICKETGHFPRIITGNIVTGDQFIADEKKRKWIEETFHADCVEMEGAAVAQVCVIYNIPYVIIRSLSDLANEKADIDFEQFVSYAATNSSLIVKGIFRLLSQ